MESRQAGRIVVGVDESAHSRLALRLAGLDLATLA
jgi:hypothetical protein